jgi:hypothetical protein
VQTIELHAFDQQKREGNEGPVQDWLDSLKAMADQANIEVRKWKQK